MQTLSLTHHNAIATVTLNRPDVRNAFNETTIAELTQVFQQLDKDDTVRVVVLAANGPAFCAGADLNWMKKMADYTHAENLADAGQLFATPPSPSCAKRLPSILSAASLPMALPALAAATVGTTTL